VRVLPTEDYFNADWIYSFGEKISNHKVRYFNSPIELFKALPKNEPLHFFGMSRQMVVLYLLMLRKDCEKDITPHTCFGKYPPWGMPINLFPVLSKLMRQFSKIKAVSKYEFQYYQQRGFSNIVYEPLFVDTGYFKVLEGLRIKHGAGVLCMGADRAIKNIKTIIKACAKAGRKLTILDDVEPGSNEFNQAFMQNDTFVSSSYMEGFSLGAAEAQASGMKLCLSNLPTLKMQYGKGALYHEPDDYEKLAVNISSGFRI